MDTPLKYASKMIEKKADYVLAVKDNQGLLAEQVRDSFLLMDCGTVSEEIDCGHGRVERRCCSVIADLSSVGARRVGAGEAVLEAQFATCLGELERAVGWPVVGEHGLEANAQPGVPVQRGAQAGDDRVARLVRIDTGEGDAAMVVDGDVDVLPASSRDRVATVAGNPMRGPNDASQLLDVQMQQVAGRVVLVALDDRRWLQMADAVELQTPEDAAHRGAAQARVLRDPIAGPALPAQGLDALDLLAGGRTMQPVRTRTAVSKTCRPLLPKAPYPLGRRLRRDAEAGRGQLQRHTLLHDFPGQQLSTPSRQSGILMTVHSISS